MKNLFGTVACAWHRQVRRADARRSQAHATEKQTEKCQKNQTESAAARSSAARFCCARSAARVGEEGDRMYALRALAGVQPQDGGLVGEVPVRVGGVGQPVPRLDGDVRRARSSMCGQFDCGTKNSRALLRPRHGEPPVYDKTARGDRRGRFGNLFAFLLGVHAQKVAVAVFKALDGTVGVEELVVLALTIGRIVFCERLLVRLVEVVGEGPLLVAIPIHEAVRIGQAAIKYEGDIDNMPAVIGRDHRIRTDPVILDQILRGVFKFLDELGRRFDGLDRIAVVVVEAAGIGAVREHELVHGGERLVGDRVLAQVVGLAHVGDARHGALIINVRALVDRAAVRFEEVGRGDVVERVSRRSGPGSVAARVFAAEIAARRDVRTRDVVDVRLHLGDEPVDADLFGGELVGIVVLRHDFAVVRVLACIAGDAVVARDVAVFKEEVVVAARVGGVHIVVAFGEVAVIGLAVEPCRALVGRLQGVEQLAVRVARRVIFFRACRERDLGQREVLIGVEGKQDVIDVAVGVIFRGIEHEGSVGDSVHRGNEIALRGDRLAGHELVVDVLQRLLFERFGHAEVDGRDELVDDHRLHLRLQLHLKVSQRRDVVCGLVVGNEVVLAQRVEEAGIGARTGVHRRAFHLLVLAALGNGVEPGIDGVIDLAAVLRLDDGVIGVVEHIGAGRDGTRIVARRLLALLGDDVLFIGVDGVVDGAHHDVGRIVGLVVGEEVSVRGDRLCIIPFRSVHRRQIAVDGDVAVHAQRIRPFHVGIAVVRVGVVAVDEHFALAQVVQHRHLRVDLIVDQRVEQELEGLRIGVAARGDIAVTVGDEVSDEIALMDRVGGEDLVHAGSDARVQLGAERLERVGKHLFVLADVYFGDDLLHVFVAVDADKELAAGHQAERKRQRQHDTDDLDKFFLHNRICLEFLV